MTPPLACTVRDCGLLLEQHERSFSCARRHAYDLARTGYLNLLQPQDRKSHSPGDTKVAIEARAKLLASGVGRASIDEIATRAIQMGLPDSAVVADLGAGSGELLGAIAALQAIVGVGVDISTAAADYAARRFPALTWVVANADRRIPLIDRSADLVVSLHGRRHPKDCARVLTRGGALIIAVPAADDLMELRATVLGAALERERTEALVSEHQPFFTLSDRGTVRERHTLGGEALRDLLHGTYRGARTREAARADSLQDLEVTLASEILVFKLSADKFLP